MDEEEADAFIEKSRVEAMKMKELCIQRNSESTIEFILKASDPFSILKTKIATRMNLKRLKRRHAEVCEAISLGKGATKTMRTKHKRAKKKLSTALKTLQNQLDLYGRYDVAVPLTATHVINSQPHGNIIQVFF